jgi:adenylate cyclase
MARFVEGDILKAQHKFDLAISEFEAAIENDRNLALAYEALGHAKTLIGRSNEAIAPIERALRLSPHDPALNLWLFHMCHAFTHLRRYSEAIPWCLKSVAAGPLWLAYVDLAADYAWTGHATEAKSAVSELLKLMVHERRDGDRAENAGGDDQRGHQRRDAAILLGEAHGDRRGRRFRCKRGLDGALRAQ